MPEQLELLEWLESQPNRYARVVDLPVQFRDGVFLGGCVAEKLINAATVEPGQNPHSAFWTPHIGTGYAPWPDIVAGLAPDASFCVRATDHGCIELAKWLPGERPDAGGAVRSTADTTTPFNNPSVPVTKQQAADAWGGSMTVQQLTSLMRGGKVPYRELTRQSFIFSCDDIPA